MKNKVLIVDDEISLLNALVDKFKRSDFDVFIAKNGKIGLKTALKNKPDIILLDIIMPVMDGLAMLNELRKDPWGKKVKVIMLTNLSDPNGPNNIVTKTTVSYLVKSDWKISDVVKKVKKELNI
jgi:DNA-binding response OmpR family regulator